MKKFAITFLILLSSGSLFAQGKFGILTYQLPDHWEMAQESDNLILFNPDSPECRIALFPPSQTLINTEAKFVELRNQKINELGFQNYPFNPIEALEEDGWTIMKSEAVINTPQNQWAYMITFSDTSVATGLIFESSDALCQEEIVQMLSSFGIDPSTSLETTATDSNKPQQKGKGKPIKDLRRMADPQNGKGKIRNYVA